MKNPLKPPQIKENQVPERKPAVAGSFYPSDSKELESLISDLLNKAERKTKIGKCRILIVPHAGINFSGRVAAEGFKQVQDEDYSRVILLGVSHRSYFNHAAVYDKGVWVTPLGKVLVDENLAKQIIDEKEKILSDLSSHEQEHSLEIELIFLQKVLKEFKILPILVSQPSPLVVESLSTKLSEILDEETLLVISSDLSHYPSWETANTVDKQTISAILSASEEKFQKTLAEQESESYPGLETSACGAEAIKIGLKTAKMMGLQNFREIKYENSGDVTGEKSQVVGYASITLFEAEEKSPLKDGLDKKTQKEALEIARKTLEQYLQKRTTIQYSPKNEALSKPLGAFVTLRKKGELRGCIGEFEPTDPLYKVIQKMSIAAASQDPRFLPVSKEELEEIKIEISAMTPKRKIEDWRKIKLGKQGVVIQKDFNSGTFLPQVATETGWNIEEFLGELCQQKAGLPSNCYQDPNVSIYVFEAQVFAED